MMIVGCNLIYDFLLVEVNYSLYVFQCTVPYCTIMMDIFNHMTTCRAGKSCSEPHCLCSNQILFHWEHCKLSPRCPICDPIRKAYKNASDSNEFLDFFEEITLQAFPSSCDILRAFEALGI
ncbi:hypothetical protein J6590_091694 [Homalodisca vitripennis]|nr:hypothetical protein J6590_091694 [Homalodisca vitripennis]